MKKTIIYFNLMLLLSVVVSATTFGVRETFEGASPSNPTWIVGGGGALCGGHITSFTNTTVPLEGLQSAWDAGSPAAFRCSEPSNWGDLSTAYTVFAKINISRVPVAGSGSWITGKDGHDEGSLRIYENAGRWEFTCSDSGGSKTIGMALVTDDIYFVLLNFTAADYTVQVYNVSFADGKLENLSGNCTRPLGAPSTLIGIAGNDNAMKVDGFTVYNGSVFNESVYNETFFPTAAATGEMNVNLLSPTNNSGNNTNTIDFTFNFTNEVVLGDTITANCSLYTNMTGTWEINITNSSALVNDSNNTFEDIQLNNEVPIVWNVECATVGDIFSFADNNFTFTIDSTDPIIDTILSSNDYYTSIGFNLSAWINATDENLYSFFVNDTITGTIFNFTNINGTSYNFSLNLNTTNYSGGGHEITVSVADGHTTNSINNWSYSKNPLTKEIEFDFSKRWFESKYLKVKPKGAGIFDTFEAIKQKDKYIYSYETSAGKTSITFIVSSSDHIDIINRANSKYNGWLVNPNLKKWTDFNIQDATGKEVYAINRINNKEVEVTISNLDGRELYIFESSGDLNVKTETYTWYMSNVTETFEINLIEKTTTDYTLNITKGIAAITTAASFIYNGTEQTLTKTDTTAYDFYTVSVEHPEVNNRIISISFNWTYNISSPTANNSYQINRNDSLNQIIIEECGNNKTITYSIVAEDNSTPIFDYDFEGLYRVWDYRNSGFVRNYSFTNISLDYNNSLCVYPDYAEYRTNYESTFLNDSFAQRQIIVNGGYFNATNQNKTIYLTLSSETTDITINIIDENDDPLAEYIIEAWKYILSDDDYILIDTEKADLDGQVLFNLDVEDKEYKFIVKNPGGATVLTISKQKLIKTLYTFTVILGTTQEHIQAKLYQLDIDIIANRLTKTFNVTWNDIGAVATRIIFRVYHTNSSESNVIYHINSTDGSGTFNYTITTSANTSATYFGNIYAISIDNGLEYYIKGDSIDVRQAWDIFGTESIITSFLLVGTLIFIGAAVSIEGAIILAILGIVISFWGGWLLVSAASIIGLIVSLIILMFKIKRGTY